MRRKYEKMKYLQPLGLPICPVAWLALNSDHCAEQSPPSFLGWETCRGEISTEVTPPLSDDPWSTKIDITLRQTPSPLWTTMHGGGDRGKATVMTSLKQSRLFYHSYHLLWLLIPTNIYFICYFIDLIIFD